MLLNFLYRCLIWLVLKYRSSRLEKGVLKNFAKFTGKQLCQSLFNKVSDLRSAALLKKRLCTGAYL